MFEVELEAALGDSRALTDLAADVERDSRIAGCRKLLVAAVWADAHSSVDHPDGGLLVERLVQLGPVGCPPVAEFAAQGPGGPVRRLHPVRPVLDRGRVDHPPPPAEVVGTRGRRRRAPLESPTDRHPDRSPGGGGGRRSRPADGRLGGAAAVADVPEGPRRHHAAGRRIHLPGTGTTRRGETGSPGHTVGSRAAHPDRPRRSRRRDHDAGALPPRRRVPGRRRRRRPPAGADVESDRDHREPGPIAPISSPGTPTTPTPTGSRGRKSPPTTPIRPTRGPTTSHPQGGKPPGTATTTNPDQTTTRGGTHRGPTTSRTRTGWSTDAQSPSPTATTSPGIRPTGDRPTRSTPTATR